MIPKENVPQGRLGKAPATNPTCQSATRAKQPNANDREAKQVAGTNTSNQQRHKRKNMTAKLSTRQGGRLGEAPVTTPEVIVQN